MGKVMQYLYGQPDNELFKDISLAQYERLMAEACTKLKYKAVIVQPHILRRSSASNDFFFSRRDLLAIQKRGRWQSRKSVSRCEKSAMMTRQWKFADPARVDSIMSSPRRLVSFLHTQLQNR